MACKDRESESSAARRDNIATGAIALGELVSGEASWRRANDKCRAAGVPENGIAQVPDEMARDAVRFAAGLVQLVKRVCAEERNEGPALAPEDGGHVDTATERVAVGDGFRRASGPSAGGVVEVTELGDETAIITAQRGTSWVVVLEALLDPAEWTRVELVAKAPGERLLADDGRCTARSYSGDACKLATAHGGVHEGPRGTFDAVSTAPTERSVGGHELRAPRPPRGANGVGRDGFAPLAPEDVGHEPDMHTAAGDAVAPGVSDAALALVDMAAVCMRLRRAADEAAAELHGVELALAAIVVAWRGLGAEVMPGSPGARLDDAIGVLERRVESW